MLKGSHGSRRAKEDEEAIMDFFYITSLWTIRGRRSRASTKNRVKLRGLVDRAGFEPATPRMQAEDSFH
jgi:hypothetical protein